MTAHPYNGTSGWSGTETSRQRMEYEDIEGISGRRRQEVLRVLLTLGPKGITWQEAADRLGLHHGQASGALSGLHKMGYIVRLQETRRRCKVYVLPQFVGGREIERFRPNPKKYAQMPPVSESHFLIVEWLDRESKNPDQNSVYQNWAALFRNKISAQDYLEDHA